ncbi:MAG: beta-lactamase family protein [Actinomycetota bacterium]|nr:beta-lactamase family protein [Actinomycetota bacterium]
MRLRTSRRRAMQAALATAATVTLPRSRTAAQQATPTAGGEATITAAQVQSAVDRLDSLIEDGMAQTGLPGAAVAVVYNDEVIYERGFGVRELGKPEPITPETVFQIASLSKSISSTLVAAVVGDGTTTWDATIDSLEPGFALSDPWVSNQVTIRDMLCHRSGLPSFGGDPLVFYFGYDREECIRRLRSYPLATPFRTTWAYSNLGFSAGAYAAASAAGESWEDLAEERLFAPLGMTSTSYRFEDFGRWENRAAPHYRTSAGVWEPGDLTDDDAAAPAGGVSSNLRDLTRWLRLQLAGGMFDGQQVVASDHVHETYQPQIVLGSPGPGASFTSFYGLGWYVSYDDRGRLVVTHGGDFNSYSTQANLLPGSGLGIVVLCNGGASAVRGAIPEAFLEMVTKGEPSRDWVSAIETASAAYLASILATSAPFPQGEPPADAAPPLPLDAYTGTYTNTTYGEVTVRDEAGDLVLAFGPTGVQRTLVPWTRDTFSMPLPGSDAAQISQLGVLFTIGPEGQADAALVSLGGVGPDAAATFTRVTGS